MHHCTMPNVGTFFQQDSGPRKHVHNTTFLDIDPVFQDNFAPIPSQHCTRTHIAMGPNGHMTDHCRLGMDKGRLIHHRHHAFEGVHHEEEVF